MNRRPPRGTIARYRDRIVEVMGEARGQRVMIQSIHATDPNASPRSNSSTCCHWITSCSDAAERQTPLLHD
jgi:hypothetical protein